MTVSQTEQKIIEFEAHIESEKFYLPPMGTYIKKKEIDQYLNEIKLLLKQDLSELHNVMRMKQQIILEAQEEADRIRQRAQKEVESQNITLQANEMARDMIKKAQTKAESILSEAKDLRDQLIINTHKYSDNILDDMEKELVDKLDKVRINRDEFRASLDKKMELMQQSNF